MESDFEKDNAFLLSSFERVKGLVLQLKSENKSLDKQVIGLRFQNENLESEVKSLKKNNFILKEEIKSLKEEIEKEKILIPQNFNIRNKIVRIVTDIEDKDANTQDLKSMVLMLIKEIDYCISQLEE